MEHRGGGIAFFLFVAALNAALIGYGLKTGKLPTKSGVLQRTDNPVAFFLVLIVYSCICIASLYGAMWFACSRRV
jgi:hypothetical protein